MKPKDKPQPDPTKMQDELIPRLRFPEFQDAGGWIVKTLKNTCMVNPENSGLPEKFIYIDLESVESGELRVRKIINRDEAPSRAQRLLCYGDIIFQIVRPYQRNNLHLKSNISTPYVASTGYAQLRANESADFLFQVLHTDDFVKQVVKKCTGSSYPAISSSDLVDIPVAIPHNAEQQKIAYCLSSLDELIAAEVQRLNALKTHKKGLMQQLFPREGETIPRLRFPEFQNAGEWEEKRLKDICDKIMDGTHFSPKSKSGPYMYITSKNIRNGMIDLSSISMISEEDHKVIYNKCPVKFNDILLTKDGSNTGNCAINDLNFEFSILSSIAILRGGKRTNQRFLYQTVLSDKVQKVIQEAISGQAITRITLEKIANFTICVPLIEEQQKIADCLSSLDELIAAETQKLNTLKTHKKGLMQQLFPIMDEVKI